MITKFIAPEFIVAGLSVLVGLTFIPIAIAVAKPGNSQAIDPCGFVERVGEGTKTLCIFDS